MYPKACRFQRCVCVLNCCLRNCSLPTYTCIYTHIHHLHVCNKTGTQLSKLSVTSYCILNTYQVKHVKTIKVIWFNGLPTHQSSWGSGRRARMLVRRVATSDVPTDPVSGLPAARRTLEAFSYRGTLRDPLGDGIRGRNQRRGRGKSIVFNGHNQWL